MNLYLVSQNINGDYDSFDSFVVAAEDEESARYTHPSSKYKKWNGEDKSGTWCAVQYVVVSLIGVAQDGYKNKQIICASFNAG
jgi:hypothetical protein